MIIYYFYKVGLIAVALQLSMGQQQQGLKKLFNLKLLALMPITGNAPRNGFECRAAAQVAIDQVNNNTEILSDYKIELAIEDESTDGLKGVDRTLKFLEAYQNSTLPSTFMAPAMVAGYYSSGCKSLGGTLHHLNLVAFSIFCSSYFLSNRKLYPNLYLTRATAIATAHSMLYFMRTIGNWHKVAIISYQGNTNAQIFYNLAIQNNVSVVWYDSVMDINVDDPSLAESLKKTDARIFSIWGDPFISLKFLCHTYKFGLTGNRFAFVGLLASMVELSLMAAIPYPGCTKEIVAEQYKYTFAMGPPQTPFDRTSRAVLGYDADAFEIMYDRQSNYSRGPDYAFRYPCHDTILEALITLDESEKAMKTSGMNLTLRNFRDQPGVVTKFVNNSARNLDYSSLRTGRIRYTVTGELATDVHTLAYLGTNKITTLGIVRQRDKTVGDHNDDYTIQLTNKVPWFTPDGKPPRDSSIRHQSFFKVPVTILVIVIILAALGSLGTATGMIKAATCIQEVKIGGKEVKIISGCGCIFLYIAAVLFALVDSGFMWHIRIAFLVIGLAVVNGILLARVQALKGKLTMISNYRDPKLSHGISEPSKHNSATQRERTSSFKLPQSNTSSTKEKSSIFNKINNFDAFEDADWQMVTKNVFLDAGIFVALNPIVLIVWFNADSIRCQLDKSYPTYVASEDAYYEELSLICYSTYQNVWQFLLLAGHVLCLAVACFQAYDLHSRHFGSTLKELSSMIVGIINASAIVVASVLILFLLKDQSDQCCAIAFIAIMYSSLSSVISFAYLIKRDSNENTNTMQIQMPRS